MIDAKRLSDIFKRVYNPTHFETETRPTHDFNPLLALVSDQPHASLYDKERQFRRECRRLKLLPEKLFRFQDFVDLEDEENNWWSGASNEFLVTRAETDFMARCRELNLL